MRFVIDSKHALFILGLSILFALCFDYVLNLTTVHSLYVNILAILSTLTIVLLMCITWGLYRGIKIKDSMGSLKRHIDMTKIPDLSGVNFGELPSYLGDFAEGLGGFLLALLAGVVIVAVCWAFILISWFSLVALAAMLYWIFYRALRLVFRYSLLCKGSLKRSIMYSSVFTLLYVGWIYGVVITLHFIR